MLFYSQRKGEWTDDLGEVIASGCYAGNGIYKNDPSQQAVKNHGPLPQGQYTISPLHTIPHLGPAMILTPAISNEMFARSDFFAHLDNPAHPGHSSNGCIVFANDGELSGHEKQMLIEARRAAGEDQVTVIA
jgi:hypothetical protein